tara:strand:- start:21591 stop:21854 length:264 start_codon:yes stop_codon:yes gene_type:complete
MRTHKTFEVYENLGPLEIKALITLKFPDFVADCIREGKAFSLSYSELSNARFYKVYDKSINKFALEILERKDGIVQVKFPRRKLSIS